MYAGVREYATREKETLMQRVHSQSGIRSSQREPCSGDRPAHLFIFNFATRHMPLLVLFGNYCLADCGTFERRRNIVQSREEIFGALVLISSLFMLLKNGMNADFIAMRAISLTDYFCNLLLLMCFASLSLRKFEISIVASGDIY